MHTSRELSQLDSPFVIVSACIVVCLVFHPSSSALLSHICLAAHLNQAPDSVSPKDILLQQPDFLGKEIVSDFEITRGSGSRLSTKLAKKGACYRRETHWAVFYSKPNEPTIRFWKENKSYDYLPPTANSQLWFVGVDNPAIFAENNFIEFEVAGSESIENHDCLKIKASPRGRAGEAAVFYAAKDLRNLVIKTVLTQPGRVTTYLVREISFDVPDDLFQVPQTIRRPLGPNTACTRPPQRAAAGDARAVRFSLVPLAELAVRSWPSKAY